MFYEGGAEEVIGSVGDRIEQCLPDRELRVPRDEIGCDQKPEKDDIGNEGRCSSHEPHDYPAPDRGDSLLRHFVRYRLIRVEHDLFE